MTTALPLLLEWTERAGEYVFSPTGISGHVECARKWAWKYIGKIPSIPHSSAALGTRCHSTLERYLDEGARPDFVTDREVAEIVSSGLHLLPAPKTDGVLLEQDFRFKSERTGFIYHGFKDIEIRPGVPQVQLGLDGSVPVVIDHKTTKSINDYAKSEDDLQFDSQSTIYGLDSMLRFDASAADLAWIYYQTKGAKRAHPSVTRLHRKHALKVFDAIESVAEEAANAFEKKLEPLDLPPNPDACGAYGGCPYRHLCNLSPSQRARSRMSNSTIASLRARVQGQTAPVITEQSPPKPEVPASGDAPLPAWATAPVDPLKEKTAPVRVNPPESSLALPTSPIADTGEKSASADTKTPRKRRTKAEIAADNTAKDPKGADVHMHTNAPTIDELVAEGHDVPTSAIEPITFDDEKQELEETIAATTRAPGFTLYVDCIPIGRPAKAAARLIERAQERMSVDGPQDKDGNRACDYRLVDFGKGAPFLVKFVLEQVDDTFDLALDTRSPEGQVLLEPLMARAAFVVRGFR